MRTAFDYMYRDAGNFKAFGTIILEGQLGAADRALVRSQLSDGEFFIAEQIGVPPLYDDLYRWSGGVIESDHCWHEFMGFREIAECPECYPNWTTAEFVSRFAAVTDWNESLSPHFAINAV
jgi:hypothetical protein